MKRFEIGDKVQIHSIPLESPDARLNFKLAEVQAMPGFNKFYPLAYGIVLQDGSMKPALERYLRPDLNPPKGRGDVDLPVSWAEFEQATGLSSAMITRNPDY